MFYIVCLIYENHVIDSTLEASKGKAQSNKETQSTELKIMDEIRGFSYALQAAIIYRLARIPQVNHSAIHF